MYVYRFGHKDWTSKVVIGTGTSTLDQYSTQPFEFVQPATGKQTHQVHCNVCGQEVPVKILSRLEIWKKRLITLPIFIVLTGLVIWVFAAKGTLMSEEVIQSVKIILFLADSILGIYLFSRIVENKNNIMFEMDRKEHSVIWRDVDQN